MGPARLLLTGRFPASGLANMEVHFKPETESRLHELASQSGRPTDELVEDAMAAYLSEVAEVRALLDSRYDDIKNGRVKPVDGETFFESLRCREDDLLKQRSSK
jgi:predicted DNA-binding protein